MSTIKPSKMAAKSKQKGEGTISYIIGAALMIVSVAGIYSMYNSQQQDNKVVAMKAVASKFLSTISAVREAEGDYASVNDAYVWRSSRLVLDQYKTNVAGTFQTPFSDGLEFASFNQATTTTGRVMNGANRFAGITFPDVDAELCQDTVEQMILTATEVRVGANRVANLAAASAECGRAGNTVDLTFIGE